MNTELVLIEKKNKTNMMYLWTTSLQDLVVIYAC